MDRGGQRRSRRRIIVRFDRTLLSQGCGEFGLLLCASGHVDVCERSWRVLLAAVCERSCRCAMYLWAWFIYRYPLFVCVCVYACVGACMSCVGVGIWLMHVCARAQTHLPTHARTHTPRHGRTHHTHGGRADPCTSTYSYMHQPQRRARTHARTHPTTPTGEGQTLVVSTRGVLVVRR